MGAIVLFLLALIGVFCFFNKKYVAFLLIATFISFNGFSTLGLSTERTNLDAFIIMNLAILAVQLVTSKSSGSYKRKSKIGKAIIILLIYTTIRTFIAIVLGEETVAYSIKVLRTDFFRLSFFVFSQIDNTDIKKFFKALLTLAIIVGIFYGISLIEWLASGQTTKLVNRTAIFALSAPLLYLLYVEKIVDKNRYILVGVFVVLLMMTFSRGLFMAVGASLVYYLFIFKRKKNVLLPAIVFLPLFLYLFSVLDKNKATEMSGMSTAEEIQYAMNLSSYDDFQGAASFGNRFAMVWEKSLYLSEHPSSLVWGVGPIHEDSPNNRFQFLVGTYKTIDGVRSKQQIDTDDVAMLSHVFRYGIVWLFLFLYFIVISFKTLKRNREKPFVIAAELMLLTLCLVGFSNDFFSELPMMLMPLILLSRANQLTLTKSQKEVLK